MSLQDTPQSERIHIGFFGRRNAGKSSLINAIAGQPVSLVSETPGTTTDPVRKAMEILPLGPVLLIDTPGIDDEGSLGEMRVARSKGDSGDGYCTACFVREGLSGGKCLVFTKGA